MHIRLWHWGYTLSSWILSNSSLEKQIVTTHAIRRGIFCNYENVRRVPSPKQHRLARRVLKRYLKRTLTSRQNWIILVKIFLLLEQKWCDEQAERNSRPHPLTTWILVCGRLNAVTKYTNDVRCGLCSGKPLCFWNTLLSLQRRWGAVALLYSQH